MRKRKDLSKKSFMLSQTKSPGTYRTTIRASPQESMKREVGCRKKRRITRRTMSRLLESNSMADSKTQISISKMTLQSVRSKITKTSKAFGREL